MYTYGPVPSRRLGRSLGVSPIPAKTCSYSCVYCQLGRTDHLQTERQSFFPREELLAEIEARGRQTDPDFVTFVGDGEPTLCADLGWLIGRTRDALGLPVAVITNGSLLWREDVRRDLGAADVVIPTLDAGSAATFRRIDRPHRRIGFGLMLDGLIEFRRGYRGRLWLEVMLLRGLNDRPAELASLRRAVERVRPDSVSILTPIRPPAESWVRPPTAESIVEAQTTIGQAIVISGLEAGEFGLEEFTGAAQAIMEIGRRHPLRLEQARRIEARFSEPGATARLLATGMLVQVDHGGEQYLLPAGFLRDR
ncbi:MAG: radical SAM protein [Candidatus Eiseniibacteriota bacterium]|jgi:wyosine [tRNA(Phe)-imidazoG37] synthetase (radical SAM superfamily)